jgi:putative membrane protein insertion efficiency factor
MTANGKTALGHKWRDPRPNITWVSGRQPDAGLEHEAEEYLRDAQCPRHSLSLPSRLTRTQRGVIRLLYGYQRRISPHLARTCIYQPSCSDYAILTVAYNGTLAGTFDALRRWTRCRPSSPGGVDYPRGCDVPH